MSNPIQNSPYIKALKENARKNGTPLFGAFELTSRCNLDCKMCFVHTTNSKELLSRELSTAQWLTIMDTAYNAGMMFALLTGGECLLRKDFKEIYLHLFNKGVIVSVNTNAILVNKEYATFFAQHKPERIQISLYGSNDCAYERVTGHRKFKQVSDAIELLLSENVHVEIAITPSSYMYEDIHDIIEYAVQRSIPYQLSDSLIAPRDGSDKSDCALSVEQRLHILQIQQEVLRKSPYKPQLPAIEPGGSCRDVITGMPCNAGTCRFIIDWTGKMIPCLSIPEISINALIYPFTDCWEYINSTMKQVKRPVECSGCVYERACVLCPVIKYDGLFSGHCNKDRCSFTKRKYELGLINPKRM